MATPQYSTTSDTTNAGRASRVMLGPCSAQLRDLLRDHVPPQKFPQIIRQKMANHKWTKPQRDLILPSTGQYSGNYSDFDISLLYTLLRNLCNIPKHNKGWGNDPDPNDMSLAANIERIRICRNRLGHALDFSLSDLEFNDIWSSISTAVIEIDKVLKSNHKHEKDVDFLRYEPMDSEMANYFEETLRKQYEEDLEIKSLLSEHIKCSDQHIKRSDQHIKCSDEKLDDMKSLIVKELECTKAMIHDQERRNTNIGVQPTNQFLGFLRWILTVFGIMRILNFFWNTEELMELEAKEISYSSVLLQWENTINQRDNSEVLYLIEYGITRTNHAEEKIRVNSCAYRLENLKHSTEYEVQVKAVSPSGEKQHSKKIKFKTEALEKLEYTEITEASILLKWEPKKHTRGEDSTYFVEYETTQPDIKIERVEVKSCEYRLEKLRHSTEYRVQIKVKTDSGETEHTDKILFRTLELMDLEATEISNSSVLLQWENTINQRDNLEVSYLIEYGITRTNHAEEEIRVDSCAYRLENLKHSTEYEVQVKAVSPSGEKQHSKKVKFKTEALEKLEYTEITEASILLKWEPKKHTRGEDSTYFVEYETTQPDIKIERVEVKSCEYRLEKLRHSTEYRVQIKVKTDSGETEHTDKIIFRTLELMDLEATEISNSSVLLQWENTINQRDNLEVSYLIEYGITRTNHAEEEIRVDSCAYRLENLKHSIEYEVQVKAVSPSGEKQHSKKVKFKTEALEKLEYTEITEASILLKWEPKKHTREEDSTYFVEYETTQPDIKIERVEVKSCEYRLEKLRHSTEYRVQIKVKTDSGETEHTDKIIFRTLELMDLEATEISNSSVLLQWENTINQRDNLEVSYLIEYGITRTNHAEEEIRVDSCAYRLENLKHSTEYEVQVKAVSPSGEKQHSKKVKFKTEALEKLEYTEITEASILLKWEPKKHTRGEDSTYFVEYETTQPDIKIERVEVKSCEYRLEKLRHSTEYRVQIKVKTDSGETEHTDKIIFRTLELMDLEATEISNSSVLLQWENTINQRDNLEVSYLIEYGITRTNHAEEEIRVDSCAYRLENLKHSTEYEVQVKAVSPSGEKQHSKKVKFKTEALEKLEYTEITEASILLKWELKKHTRGEDSTYFVEYETTQPDIKIERVEVKSCEYRLEKLRHSTEYRVQIKVKTDSGETEHTDKIIFRTLELMDLEATEISNSSVLLQWENTINQRDNLEVSYLIEYGITRTNHAEEEIRVDSCAYRLENLKHSTEYEVQVKAVSPSGEKQHSKKVKFKTEALEKLEYTEITEASILLKWEPKKHTRGEDSAGFIVEYETTQPDIKIERVEVKSCEYRLEKLKHSTEYGVQIKVKTDSGETEHTDKIIFETRRHTARGLSDLEIQAFERDLKKSEVRLKNVRLMAIGHQGVGKTTLLHRLRNLASNPSEAELSTIFPTKSIKTDLNYAVCTGNGSIICLGEEDICRRKLGMRLEEKDKPVKGESAHSNSKAGKDKQTFKRSSEYTHKSRHGDTSSRPEVDNGSLSRIENKTSESKIISNRNGTESTDIKKDTNRLSAKKVEPPKTDTVKSHSTVIDETNKGEVLNESESGSAQKDSKDIAKKSSVIEDELAHDLREVLKKAQIGTEDESFISYWDFAGEDAYHDTHVAFMSSDAIYLLLFNAAELVNEEYSGRQEEHLIFWLQNIASLRSKNESTPPVIVMGTHMDELNVEFKPEVKGKLEDKIRQIARDQGALSNLQGIFLKNLKTDMVLDVWETIQDSRKKQEHWNQKVPTKMQILEYILTLEKVRSYSSSKEKIQATWGKIGGGSEDEDDLNLYLKVLSNSGSILFLEHDKNVILDISWIIKRFSDIFSPDSRKSHSALSDLKDEGRIDREIFFQQFMPKNEKEGNDALNVFLFLGLIVESNGYITVPAYLKEKNLDLTGMRHMVEQKKGNENIKMSKTLAVTFKRGETPLSTIFFNSILVVLINTFRKKLNSPTQRETCLTSIGKTSGILDDLQDYGLLYEMKKSTLKLIVFSRRSSGIRTNILREIISKINKVNYAYNKKHLDMILEISEGYTVPFHSKKGKEQMEIWTSTCDHCGEWKDIAYQTGKDLTFIDDEGWLEGCEDVGGVVFECMKCFNKQRESLKKLLVQAQDVPCKTGRLLEEHVVIRYDTKLPENRIAHEVDDGIEIITKNPYYVSDEAILASNLNLSGRSGKRSIPATDLLIIKDCIRTNADNLWKKHSNLTIITGDSIKSVNRKNLPKTCIVLYCLSKGFIPIKEEPFPKELSCILGKFETDVREGYFTLGPTKEYGVLDAYNNPICMGSSIGSNWRDVSGSLGLFVNLPQNEMAFITCCHVLFDCIKPYVFHYQKEATSAPRYVVQPGNTSLCGREYAERECGEIVKAKFDPCSSQISVDVALVKISKRKPTTGHFVIKDQTQSKELGFTKDELPVFDTGELRRNIRPRDHDKLLLKSGTSTGLTRSLFRMDGPQVRIFQEGAWLGSKDQRDVIMKGQIEVEGGIINKTFFEPGDSGSAVFIKEPDGQLACIGIAIGKTSYGTTVVTPIGTVLDALGLNDSDVTKFS